VTTYNDEGLRQLLDLWEREGSLTRDQMHALAEWEQTPEDAREAFARQLKDKERRQTGPEEPDSRSLLQRLIGAVRALFPKRR